jgi:hypothetical protein
LVSEVGESWYRERIRYNKYNHIIYDYLKVF